MVDERVGSDGAAPGDGPVRRPLVGFVDCLARLLAAVPALVAGLAVLRAGELFQGWPPATHTGEGAALIAGAFAQDLLTIGRTLPILLVISLPALALRSPRLRWLAIGGLWSVLILVELALVCYFLNAHVPLGADLFSYSWDELRTSAAGSGADPVMVAAAAIGTAAMWFVLWRRRTRGEGVLLRRAALPVFVLCTGLLAAGPRELPPLSGAETEYAHSLRLSKLAAFADGNVDSLMEHRLHGARLSLQAEGAPAEAAASAAASADPIAGFRYLDPRYPFLHSEQTPDVLGPQFTEDRSTPPNFVFIIVEGLGRNFSGPGASLGSFTPFLDELAGRSLYFENFLSAQGRTFAVLPSVFGSLPYGDEGFLAHGAKMPEHATLLSILKGQGYRTRFFCGFDTTFDNEEAFLQRQGVDEIYGRKDFGAATPRISYWGFDDNELVAFASEHESQVISQPFLDVVQTVSMHDPYRFLGQERYASRFEQRLNELGLADEQKGQYRAQHAIYESVLYTDDALRRYFEAAKAQPWFDHTIFVVTGDHRLPEIPMGEWIDRYHVPLLIYSPLLRQPRHIKAVSSQFDIAPSVLAFLADGHGVRTPASVAWIGSGLDLEPGFRNVHDLPLKQTKPTLDVFVHGQWAVSRNALYRLHDGMTAEPVRDDKAYNNVQSRFRAFLEANRAFERTGALVPEGASRQWVAFDASGRAAVDSAPEAGPALAVGDVKVPERAPEGGLAIDVVISNAGAAESASVVPLAVLQTAEGVELSESYGEALRVPARSNARRHLPIKTEGVPPGQYFLSVFPSDPANGVRIGDGRFHIPVVIGP